MRNSELKVPARKLDITDLETQQHLKLFEPFDATGIEKYAVIESLKHLMCKGDTDKVGETDLRIQKQYRSSQ